MATRRRIVAWALRYGQEPYVYRVVLAIDFTAATRREAVPPMRWVPLVEAQGQARRIVARATGKKGA